MINHFKNKALTIAGSDSGAGAGIQADLKTFSSLGVYGTTVLTAVTAQNTIGVQGVEMLPVKIVESQIKSVLSDIGTDSVKTGMLGNAEIIHTTARTLEYFTYNNLVVDPVMVAESGDPLLEDSAIEAYVNHLFPMASLVTPNIYEAEKISGIKITNEKSLIESGNKILDIGSKKVLIKGGHFNGEFSEDVLFTSSGITKLREKRVVTNNTHGTGCTLSAAITAFLAKGDNVEFAVRKGKEYVTKALQESYDIGKGTGPVNHFFGT
ncbi:MAG: bifunctional hydroxymethylpyrimidine kinase/phosphomethylpyrimidine kinase [Actinobacteria bacterium]|jgi:hydroxymethylpyrimidine/phosphomethylpyrimidine kinase|nr:bifunctional hydroxymethylpyrimidine kinase/phosphomethylpyrimidine kinase [Actinomycetota bacterium]